MPYYNFICETCLNPSQAWRTKDQGPPRFCCNVCKSKGLSLSISGKSRRPPKYRISPLLHEQIRKLYEGETGQGQVGDFAKRAGLPRWKVGRYAQSQGWIAVQKKEPPWSERELRILEQSAHCQPAVIRRHLKAMGFTRSEVGISLKRKRMRFLSNLKGQSATTLALCFGVDAKTIIRYIEKGYLQSKKRGTARTPQQGGDEWFIKDVAIKKFVQTYSEYVDFRKVDKIWLIDLLAGILVNNVKDADGYRYEENNHGPKRPQISGSSKRGEGRAGAPEAPAQNI